MEHTPGPWVFEPHNGYGTSLDGEAMPYGYISEAVPMPIFELTPVLGFIPEELEANARLMAAAPDMFEALTTIANYSGETPGAFMRTTAELALLRIRNA